MRDPEQARHQKRSVKKTFTIDRRYVGTVTLRCFDSLRGWNRFRAYATEKSRDEAFEKVKDRDRGSWEYRVGENLS